MVGYQFFIKELVIGPERMPSFKVAISSINMFAREMWLRSDKNKLDLHGDEALTAKEIVEV